MSLIRRLKTLWYLSGLSFDESPTVYKGATPGITTLPFLKKRPASIVETGDAIKDFDI